MKSVAAKNYVLFLGETGAETNQAPCLSLVQFQIDEGELVISAFQRSSDANLGLQQISIILLNIKANRTSVEVYNAQSC